MSGKRELDPEAVYEELKRRLGEEEAEKKIEEARRSLEKRLGWNVSRENAILTLIDEIEKPKQQIDERLTDFPAFLKHDGKRWRVYYYNIDSFEGDLSTFGKFLEKVEENGERVSAIIPNIGFVKTSWILGTSFQGVKGFAVITRKPGN